MRYTRQNYRLPTLEGGAFAYPTTVVTGEGDTEILDFTSLKSSDGKFASGMYKAGPQTFDITEPYGVDEFMFFLEGSVTLTSADGVVTKVNAGEAVTIPKEWIGRWETRGIARSGSFIPRMVPAFEAPDLLRGSKKLAKGDTVR